MKKTNTTIIHVVAAFLLLFLTTEVTLKGQAPGTLNYQAVLRDAAGIILENTNASVQLVIRQGSETGTQVYSEVHNVTTNTFGLVNLEIGSIDPTTFSAIDWATGPYFIEVIVNGTSMGTSQLLSVPYALYAASSAPGDTKWTDVTGGINYDLGNVGIGSSSPSEKLDVEGSIEIDGDLIYESAKTRYYTVSHAAFDLEVEGGSYEHRSGDFGDPEVKRVQVGGGVLNNLARLVAPINLPHGATITELNALVFDNHAYDVTIRLVRQDFTGSSAGAQTTIAMASTSGTPFLTNIIDSTIDEPVVDNQNFSYNLQFDTSENTTFVALYSVRITYTVSAAD
jgi:hypothetical protein